MPESLASFNHVISKTNNMLKKHLLKMSLGLFVSLFSSGLFAQNDPAAGSNSFGLSSNELTIILQKCIDLPELQKYYPVESDNSLKQINIVQYPISFPSDLVLAKGSKPVNFISNAALPDITADAYSMYRSIENSGNTLKVSFNYFYKQTNQGLKTVMVAIDFQKSDAGWNIISSNIKGDTL